jgi:hypothetical protein
MQATSELKIPSMYIFGDGPDSSTTEESPVAEGAPDAVWSLFYFALPQEA